MNFLLRRKVLVFSPVESEGGGSGRGKSSAKFFRKVGQAKFSFFLKFRKEPKNCKLKKIASFGPKFASIPHILILGL